METYQNFQTAIKAVRDGFIIADRVKTETWQGLSTANRPELETYEQLFVSFKVPLRKKNLNHWRYDINPDLPWADDHFAERVSGAPLNPPPSEAWWPHAASNAAFKKDGIFSHTYPERFWPRHAGRDDPGNNQGIRFRYGDLNDVVELLRREPLTRQAYLPIFFPEDTGAHHRERIPCTLGYHFIRRNGHLHTVYYLRSCDFYRHFRNDLYFAVRLNLWMIEQLWADVLPGTFVIHITSLHLFVNDYNKAMS